METPAIEKKYEFLGWKLILVAIWKGRPGQQRYEKREYALVWRR